MDYSPPGSFVHGILQARIPEWVAISISKKEQGGIHFSIAIRFLYVFLHLCRVGGRVNHYSEFLKTLGIG